MSMFSSMHGSAYKNIVMEMLKENKVNALQSSCPVSKTSPEGPHNKVWWNLENRQDRTGLDGGKSCLGS